MKTQYRDVFSDIKDGLLDWRMWGRLGWKETVRRYRRTIIGPFWTTLSLGIFIVMMGLVWAQLWKKDPKDYLLFLTAGMLAWGLFQSIVNEGCTVFTGAGALITSMQISYTMLACAVVWRNVIVLFHNVIILAIIMLYAGSAVTWYSLLVIPGLLLISFNGVWFGLVLGTICTRFRDIQQIVSSVLQIAMFVTPIFWSSAQLDGRSDRLVKYNVLYHFVDILRAPLLGKAPDDFSYYVVLGATVIGWALTIFLLSRVHQRIPYWL